MTHPSALQDFATVSMVYWLAYFPKPDVQGTGLLSTNSPEELYFFTPALSKIFPTIKVPKETNKCFSNNWE